MIIKRWNSTGSIYEEIYPKTIYTELYEANGTTPLFTSGKLNAARLPDFVFDGLKYVTSCGSNLQAYTPIIALGITDLAFLKGYYWVCSAALVLTLNSTAYLDVPSGTYWKTALQSSEEGAATGTTTVNLETGDWFILNSATGSGTSGDPFVCQIAIVNNTYDLATTTAVGVTKLGSDSVNSATAAAVGTTNGRTYLSQVNSGGQLVVNVPWTDTTYAEATTAAFGLIKLASDTEQIVAANAVTTTASRTYGIQTTSTGVAVVNVPWTDTNTTYALATASALGLIKLGDDTVQTVAKNTVTAQASRSYAVQVDSNGNALVNVPWVDTNTTYSAASTTNLGLIKLEDDTVQSVAANAVTATASRTYGLQITSGGLGVVNVPWTDTTYAKATTSALGLIKTGSDTVNDVSTNAVSSTAGRNYLVQLNTSGNAVVNIPWTDADTTYTATAKGGLELSGTAFKMTSPFYSQAADPVATIDGTIWFDL